MAVWDLALPRREGISQVAMAASVVAVGDMTND